MSGERNFNSCACLPSFTKSCPHANEKALKMIVKWLRNPLPTNYITDETLKEAEKICAACRFFEPDDS
jgi:hypothetical protein